MIRRIKILDVPMDHVGKKAVLLLREAYGKPDKQFRNEFMVGADVVRRLVSMDIDDGSMGASIEEIEKRFLQPMAHGLAQSLPGNIAFVPLELPSGCQATRQFWDDVSVRLVTGWYEPVILNDSGEIVGYDKARAALRMEAAGIIPKEAA